MENPALWLKWDERKTDELEFWERWLRTKGHKWPEAFKYRLDATAEINERRVAEAIAAIPKNAVSILDVGAGPVTSLGKRYADKSIAITATDPLADDYNRVIDALGIVPPVRTISCNGEQLLDLFQPESFDIVYARNALDHSHDPLTVIRNMVMLAKQSGLVFLRHFVNESEREERAGMHFWNFDIRNGDLVVWNEASDFDITVLFEGTARVVTYTEGTRADGEPLWVVAEMTKLHSRIA